MVNDVNSVILPLKIGFMILQVIMIILIAYARDEFIVVSSGFVKIDSPQYKSTELELVLSAAISVGLLFVQFSIIVCGVSSSFKQINALQVLIHMSGALLLIWMILDRWNTLWLPVIGALTVLVPFLLEISQIFSQISKFKIIKQIQIEQEKKVKEERQRESLRQQAVSEMFKINLLNRKP